MSFQQNALPAWLFTQGAIEEVVGKLASVADLSKKDGDSLVDQCIDILKNTLKEISDAPKPSVYVPRKR